jgi:acetyltransferase-like isoleucine patch superfamily enzyme
MMTLDGAAARLWLQKWRWYQRSAMPWNRVRIHYQLARRGAFAKWPLHGEVLEALRDGRLTIGPQVHFEPGVWLTSQPPGRITIGAGSILNMGVMVAASDHVKIGEHCMFGNGSLVTDANHRFDDPGRPVPWQGFESKGPTIIGDNVWCGVNVVIASGVTIGERCVIGANSVVTHDIPPFSVATGSPARVIKTIEHGPRQ